MELIKIPFRKKEVILALSAESAGVFAVHRKGSIFVSENFGDLLEENNFLKYKKAVLVYIKKEKIKLDIVLTDLHPQYNSAIFGAELAKKTKAKHVKIQHHIAHIFSAVGDKILQTTDYRLPPDFYGIAMDGTGFGLDGNIWGSEVFKVKSQKSKVKNARQNSKVNNLNFKIERIGSLEEQIMIGGDAAVREPARMLIAILARIMNYESRIKNKIHPVKYFAKRNLTGQENSKDYIYKFVKKFYTHNEFEALYNQMEQNFNCQKTTSTGRVLDAVSVLLGFAGNERNFKHEATKLLERNSAKPYDIKPIIIQEKISADEFKIQKSKCKMTMRNSKFILQTTPLFEYLLKNIKRDKKRLAATAQLYIAKGLYQIIHLQATSHKPQPIFAAGGMTNNKIIASYLESQGVYPHTPKALSVRPHNRDNLKSQGATNSQDYTHMGVGVYLAKKIPRGDEGIAVGQIVYYLLNEK